MRFDPCTPKTAFLFYASTLDVLEELPEKRQGEVALTLLDFAFRDDMTAPFECSEDDWIMLHHVFEGIVREKKRYQIGLRLKSIIKKLELAPLNDKDKAFWAVRIEKLKQLGELAYENPNEVGEADIIPIIGSEIYRSVSQPALLRSDLWTGLRRAISKAPQEHRKKLEEEMNDLERFCQQLYPVPTDGTQQINSTLTQAAKAAPAPAHEASSSQSPEEECPFPPGSRYAFRWKQSKANSEPKSEPPKSPESDAKDSGRKITRSEPFIPNDFDEETLTKNTPSALWDIVGFPD